jgi:hypothetical protein
MCSRKVQPVQNMTENKVSPTSVYCHCFPMLETLDHNNVLLTLPYPSSIGIYFYTTFAQSESIQGGHICPPDYICHHNL